MKIVKFNNDIYRIRKYQFPIGYVYLDTHYKNGFWWSYGFIGNADTYSTKADAWKAYDTWKNKKVKSTPTRDYGTPV